MSIPIVHRKLRRGLSGTFRPLKPGELIEASDLIVADTYYQHPAEQSIGQPCEAKDCILRLQFNEKGTH